MKAKANFFEDNPDILFHLQSHDKLNHLFSWMSPEDLEHLGVESTKDYAQTTTELLNILGEFSGSVLEANAAKVNEEDITLTDGKVELPPTITSNIEQLKELGAHYLSVSREFGGLETPMLFELVGSEMIARACPSTLLNIGWYAPIAKIIDHFGSQELKERFIPQIVDGSVSGSMALTEPDVGSDLSNMRTYGEKQEDGSWLIYGSKQFISNGNSGISLVLAQNKKGAKGLKSINLYLVPHTLDGKDNYRVTKIEEKPGLHGSATCALHFDASVGYLLGKDGEGFIYMLHLMNEARLAVGFQGLGLMEAVYRLAKQYANERHSWDKPIAQHEMIAEKLLDMETETRIFRSLLYRGAFYASMVEIGQRMLKQDQNLSEAKKTEVQKKIAYYDRKVREWTPLLKWWSGEKSFVHARTCLQIHGGYGFTKEYKPEWWVRESLILSIYEGTSEIQALMCIKDTMKEIIRRPRPFAESLVTLRVRALAEPDPLKRKYYKMKQTLNQALVKLLMKLVTANMRDSISENKSSDIMRLISHLKTDLVKFDNLSPALHNAARICEMKAIVAMAKAALEDAKEDTNRLVYAQRFINRQYPRLRQLKLEIEWNDDQVMHQAQGQKEDFAQAAQH
ncbi:MAG: acyl-CoA dehydrogenase family protein [Oligoflexus sp.]